MIIDCGSCAVAGLACDDCVVSVLLGPAPALGSDSGAMSGISPRVGGVDAQHEDDAQVVQLPTGVVASVADEHAPALAVLADAGLIPPLRLVPRSEAS